MTHGSITIERDGNKYSIETSINVQVKKKTRNWVVYSPDFNTLGYSPNSQEDALAEFKKALRVFFHIQLKRNSLDRYLINHRWSKIDHRFESPERFKWPEFTPVPVTEEFEFAN